MAKKVDLNTWLDDKTDKVMRILYYMLETDKDNLYFDVDIHEVRNILAKLSKDFDVVFKYKKSTVKVPKKKRKKRKKTGVRRKYFLKPILKAKPSQVGKISGFDTKQLPRVNPVFKPEKKYVVQDDNISKLEVKPLVEKIVPDTPKPSTPSVLVPVDFNGDPINSLVVPQESIRENPKRQMMKDYQAIDGFKSRKRVIENYSADWSFLKELIQNGANVNASQLLFTFEDDKIIVQDNGKGMRTERQMAKICTPHETGYEEVSGEHAQSVKAERRHGEGFLSVFKYFHEVTIESHQQRYYFNWGKMLETQRIQAPQNASEEEKNQYQYYEYKLPQTVDGARITLSSPTKDYHKDTIYKDGRSIAGALERFKYYAMFFSKWFNDRRERSNNIPNLPHKNGMYYRDGMYGRIVRIDNSIEDSRTDKNYYLQKPDAYGIKFHFKFTHSYGNPMLEAFIGTQKVDWIQLEGNEYYDDDKGSRIVLKGEIYAIADKFKDKVENYVGKDELVMSFGFGQPIIYRNETSNDFSKAFVRVYDAKKTNHEIAMKIGTGRTGFLIDSRWRMFLRVYEKAQKELAIKIIKNNRYYSFRSFVAPLKIDVKYYESKLEVRIFDSVNLPLTIAEYVKKTFPDIQSDDLKKKVREYLASPDKIQEIIIAKEIDDDRKEENRDFEEEPDDVIDELEERKEQVEKEKELIESYFPDGIPNGTTLDFVYRLREGDFAGDCGRFKGKITDVEPLTENPTWKTSYTVKVLETEKEEHSYYIGKHVIMYSLTEEAEKSVEKDVAEKQQQADDIQKEIDKEKIVKETEQERENNYRNDKKELLGEGKTQTLKWVRKSATRTFWVESQDLIKDDIAELLNTIKYVGFRTIVAMDNFQVKALKEYSNKTDKPLCRNCDQPIKRIGDDEWEHKYTESCKKPEEILVFRAEDFVKQHILSVSWENVKPINEIEQRLLWLIEILIEKMGYTDQCYPVRIGDFIAYRTKAFTIKGMKKIKIRGKKKDVGTDDIEILEAGGICIPADPKKKLKNLIIINRKYYTDIYQYLFKNNFDKNAKVIGEGDISALLYIKEVLVHEMAHAIYKTHDDQMPHFKAQLRLHLKMDMAIGDLERMKITNIYQVTSEEDRNTIALPTNLYKLLNLRDGLVVSLSFNRYPEIIAGEKMKKIPKIRKRKGIMAGLTEEKEVEKDE